MKHPQSNPESKPATMSRAHGRSRAAATRKPSVSANGEDHDEAIRLAAYAFYEARGRIDGHALDDWLKAQATVEQSTERTT